jgi:hypothetical protein
MTKIDPANSAIHVAGFLKTIIPPHQSIMKSLSQGSDTWVAQNQKQKKQNKKQNATDRSRTTDYNRLSNL